MTAIPCGQSHDVTSSYNVLSKTVSVIPKKTVHSSCNRNIPDYELYHMVDVKRNVPDYELYHMVDVTGMYLTMNFTTW